VKGSPAQRENPLRGNNLSSTRNIEQFRKIKKSSSGKGPGGKKHNRRSTPRGTPKNAQDARGPEAIENFLRRRTKKKPHSGLGQISIKRKKIAVTGTKSDERISRGDLGGKKTVGHTKRGWDEGVRLVTKKTKAPQQGCARQTRGLCQSQRKRGKKWRGVKAEGASSFRVEGGTVRGRDPGIRSSQDYKRKGEATTADKNTRRVDAEEKDGNLHRKGTSASQGRRCIRGGKQSSKVLLPRDGGRGNCWGQEFDPGRGKRETRRRKDRPAAYRERNVGQKETRLEKRKALTASKPPQSYEPKYKKPNSIKAIPDQGPTRNQ